MSALLLAHTACGAGPAVVLLHSGVADRRMWQGIESALGDRFRVIAADLRGFGDTPLPSGDFVDADDVVGLLDHLDVARAGVVGASLGGRVALELATRHPDRVASLALLCPAYQGVERTTAAVAYAETESRLFETGDLAGVVELNVRTWVGPLADDEARGLVRTMSRHAIDVQLAAAAASPPPARQQVPLSPADLSLIGAPTVVVTGGYDLDHFQEVGRYLAATIPDAEHFHLPWAGHLPALERPELTARLLQEALDAHR